MWDVAAGDQIHSLEGPEDSVNAVTFSPDGRILAGASQTVWLWEVETAEPKWTLEAGEYASEVKCLAFSPDGSTLAGYVF